MAVGVGGLVDSVALVDSAEGLKADVYREANDFCTKLNKKMEPVNFEMTDVGFIMPGSVSLQFRCVRNSTPK